MYCWNAPAFDLHWRRRVVVTIVATCCSSWTTSALEAPARSVASLPVRLGFRELGARVGLAADAIHSEGTICYSPRGAVRFGQWAGAWLAARLAWMSFAREFRLLQTRLVILRSRALLGIRLVLQRVKHSPIRRCGWTVKRWVNSARAVPCVSSLPLWVIPTRGFLCVQLRYRDTSGQVEQLNDL